MIIEYKDITEPILDLALDKKFAFDDDTGTVTVDSFQGQLIKIDGGYHLRGRIKIIYNTKCDRCGENAELRMDSEVSVNVIPGVVDAPGSSEYEMDDRQGDEFVTPAEYLDLNELLREEAILALPIKRLCGEGCENADTADAGELKTSRTPLEKLSVIKKAPEEKE